MMEEPGITWTRRIGRASYALLLNFLLWVLLPAYLSGYISQAGISTPLNDSFVIAFGATITGLQVMAALSEGSSLAAICSSGSYIAEAYYIWEASDGGRLVLTVHQSQVSLAFQPLLFLLVLPSLFSAVRTPLVYVLDKSEAAGPSKDQV